ncbi:MAG: guanylate kinase [Flavobacteriales bacterium]|nr:guanylate kinase [Flavobacteriales bacterium]
MSSDQAVPTPSDFVGKGIVFSAPSGAGKTTLVRRLLAERDDLRFSISATNRPQRGTEQHGVDYYFLSTEEFKEKARARGFLEWEEVYDFRFYGTPHGEVERIWASGHHVLFDLDVKGGVRVKKKMGKNVLSIFVKPPSLKVLRERLEARGTDDPQEIDHRMEKAESELTYADQFDWVLNNDDLEVAVAEVIERVNAFAPRPTKSATP